MRREANFKVEFNRYEFSFSLRLVAKSKLKSPLILRGENNWINIFPKVINAILD